MTAEVTVTCQTWLYQRLMQTVLISSTPPLDKSLFKALIFQLAKSHCQKPVVLLSKDGGRYHVRVLQLGLKCNSSSRLGFTMRLAVHELGCNSVALDRCQVRSGVRFEAATQVTAVLQQQVANGVLQLQAFDCCSSGGTREHSSTGRYLSGGRVTMDSCDFGL